MAGLLYIICMKMREAMLYVAGQSVVSERSPHGTRRMKWCVANCITKRSLPVAMVCSLDFILYQVL